MTTHKRLSAILSEVFNPERGASSYGELVDELDQHGMAIVLILFSIPSALPVPAAGYSTVLSIPLFLIGLRLLSGRDTVWIPQSLRIRRFDPKSFQKLIKPMNTLARKVEFFSRPRFTAFTESKALLSCLGLLICLLACSMALPIPGTNTAPAFGIFLIGFGLLERDTFFVLLGICASFVALVLSTLIIWFGYEFVKYAIRTAVENFL